MDIVMDADVSMSELDTSKQLDKQTDGADRPLDQTNTAKPIHVGVLLMNTGTPDAPTAKAIRPYLDEFLSDPYLIGLPRWLWLPILHLFILPSRPRKTQERYRQIWTPEGSPFMIASRAQCAGIAQRLDDATHQLTSSDSAAQRRDQASIVYDVQLAMRYGHPSTKSALEALKACGCQNLIVLPLFPQYSVVTTLTCCDQVRDILKTMEWQPSLSIIDHFCDNKAYLDLMAHQIESHWQPRRGGRLLFSYHSVPVSDIKRGDSYRDQALATSAAIADRLGLPDDQWAVGWQCRFDSRRWLSPTPESILETWASEGVEDVAEVCPVFTADCIETLVDCDVDQRACFMDACDEYVQSHGECRSAHYTYIPALADDPAFLDILSSLVRRTYEDRVE